MKLDDEFIEKLYEHIAYACELDGFIDYSTYFAPRFCVPGHYPMFYDWLNNDADAFSLITKLNINVRHMAFLSKDSRTVQTGFGLDWLDEFKTGDDPAAALRLSICWSAAAYGKTMKEMKNEKIHTKED